MIRISLLCFALTGCASFDDCTFGGATVEADAICAERNFGKDGAAYIKEREQLCPLCDTTAGPELGATEQYCTLNCWEN